MYLASHDPLTGCLNRSQLHERLQKAVTLAKAAGDVLAVIFIDPGGFKQVNDCHDHQVSPPNLQPCCPN